MTKKISIVIPVYRNEGSIAITYEKLIELILKLKFDYEIIFINDGSDDNSFNELNLLCDRDNKVSLISFSRNFGQVSAVIAGLSHVSGDAVIIMSADLQEPISLIENMIIKHTEGNEIVICHRIDREDSFVANITSSIFYRFMRFINEKMPKGGFDFILLGKKSLSVLNSIDERNRFLQGDILWMGYTVSFIPYKRLKRSIGKSQWTISKKLKYLIDGILNTSYFPIRVMSLIGVIFSTLGFIYSLLIIYGRFIHKTPFNGWAPIMILILIIGGLIMFMLGIIGEYIWRIYDETRKRPIYIIDKESSKNIKD